MKTFKSIFTLLMVNVISLIVVSCDKYESPLSGKTVADVTVESTFSTQTVNIGGANLTGFTATSSQSWCEVSTGESGVTLIVSSNETYDERKASVTVTDTEDGSILTFNVIQKQKDEINVGKLYKIPEKGGIFKIEVESNVSYTVEIPSDCDWLSQVSSTRGLSTTQITFNASKNDSGDERSTIVKVINKDAGITKEIHGTEIKVFSPSTVVTASFYWSSMPCIKKATRLLFIMQSTLNVNACNPIFCL